MKSVVCFSLCFLGFCVISESQGLALNDRAKTASTLHRATIINERYQQLITQLNENFKNFVKGITTSQDGNFKSNSNHQSIRNSLAFEEILTAANEKRLNYGPVIENMDNLLSQQMPEQMVNFIRLVKQGSKQPGNREGRVVFQSLDAWLDVFSAFDLSQMSAMAKQAPQLMKGITDLIAGIARAVEAVGEI